MKAIHDSVTFMNCQATVLIVDSGSTTAPIVAAAGGMMPSGLAGWTGMTWHTSPLNVIEMRTEIGEFQSGILARKQQSSEFNDTEIDCVR